MTTERERQLHEEPAGAKRLNLEDILVDAHKNGYVLLYGFWWWQICTNLDWNKERLEWNEFREYVYITEPSNPQNIYDNALKALEMGKRMKTLRGVPRLEDIP